MEQSRPPAPAAASSPAPEEKPEEAQAVSMPDIALLHLLQSAFNRQTPAVYTHSVASPGQVLPLRHRIPQQKLYKTLELSPKSSLYNHHRDIFYRDRAPERQQQLLQALFDILEGEQQ